MDRFRKKEPAPPVLQMDEEQQAIIDRLAEIDSARSPAKPAKNLALEMDNVRPGAVKSVNLYGIDEPCNRRCIEVVFYNGNKVKVTAAIGKGFMMSVTTGYEAWKAQEIAKKYEAWLKGAPF